MDGHNQKLIPDQIMKDIFPEDNDLEEEPMFVSKCKKISNWNIGQDRVLILSTHYIYLLSTKEIRKKVSITDVKYFVKSLDTKSKEMLLFFREGYDFRLTFDGLEEFQNLIKLRFTSLSPKVTLKVYGVPQASLRDFVAPTKKGHYTFDASPDDGCRLYNEEIPGTTDRTHSANFDMKKPKDKKQQDQDPNNFVFEGRQSLVML
jgi:hypothetical protein